MKSTYFGALLFPMFLELNFLSSTSSASYCNVLVNDHILILVYHKSNMLQVIASLCVTQIQCNMCSGSTANHNQKLNALIAGITVLYSQSRNHVQHSLNVKRQDFHFPITDIKVQQETKTNLFHLKMEQSRQKCHFRPADPQLAGTTPHLWFQCLFS